MIKLKQNDTRHAINAVLKTDNGQTVDLTSATVRFIMRANYGTKVVEKSAAQNGQPGEVWVTFDDGDTGQAGVYKAEFKVEFADGRRATYPTAGYIDITVEKELAE